MDLELCENCSRYCYDDENEEYYCSADLDEDEVMRMYSDKNGVCPYFDGYDEYKIVRKQN